MKCLSSYGFGSDWDINSVSRPWGDRPSIRAFLRDLPPETYMADVTLPDEEAATAKIGLAWAPGALDGAFGHHASGGQAEERARQVRDALIAMTRESTDRGAHALYTLMTEGGTLDYVDALLEAIVEHEDWDEERLYAVARWLAEEAPDRDAVKIGLAILGAFTEVDTRELFLALGRHEEFTLYSVVAVQNTCPDWEQVLWALGKQVRGWGRIHIVERLAETTDEHIRSWMLRDGCRNDIMNEYTALICARTGGLAEALALPEPDDALVSGAAEILSALLAGGGPAEGMEAYPEGPQALQAFLDVLWRRQLSISDFILLRDIQRFLEDDDEVFGAVGELWEPVRQALHDGTVSLLEREDWPVRVRGVVEEEGDGFWVAAQAARLLKMDIWDVYYRRLLRGENEWYAVMQTDDRRRIERVVAHAESVLPLAEIASGAGEEPGMGPEFRDHSALDFVLQDLRRFPGLGWPLIRSGLQSPVIRNRNMAVRALAEWDRDAWPSDAEAELRAALEVEPAEKTRAMMQRVVRGESWDSD
jgi:hypothetical protein